MVVKCISHLHISASLYSSSRRKLTISYVYVFKLLYYRLLNYLVGLFGCFLMIKSIKSQIDKLLLISRKLLKSIY